MAPLQHSSAELLEYPQVLEMLRAYTSSPLGRSRVDALSPRTTTEKPWMEQQLRLTEEIRQYWRTGGRFEFIGLTDPAQLLAKSRIEGAQLETLEIRDVLAVAERAEAWREIGLNPPSELHPDAELYKNSSSSTSARMTGNRLTGWPEVDVLTRRINSFSALLSYFKGKILPDGTLDDKASPTLGRIRREIEKQKREIEHTLQQHLRRLSEGGAAQEELITIRGERFVIPVKIEQRRKVQGVVHGTSSSGQTVYMEPMETIEQNNELVRLLEDEMAEVRRILAEMTVKIGERAREIAEAVSVLAELELQFAKARFAEDYGCVVPVFMDDVLRLEQAVHPVLERNLRTRKRNVIPMSLEMAGNSRLLIISGPNTGGKTVALKTVGLLALMAQSGIPVPAATAQMPIFDAVLADIGDAQSIAQDLSTFSSHITRIQMIAQTATAQSLVLLDELGSATDPVEGAALAVAIADHFHTARALTLISTHHTSLKIYATNTSGVLNASVGFDEATLQPTYQLRVGVPGASAGLNIAQRLGLDGGIIKAARASMATQSQDIATFLDKLHEQLKQVDIERRELTRRLEEVNKEKTRLDKLGLDEQRAKVKALEKKMEDLFNDFTYQMREAVTVVQDRAEQQKLSKDSERRIAKLKREFKEQFDSGVVAHRTGADIGDVNAKPHEVRYVGEGDTVKLKSLGRNARVVRRISEDLFEVEAGGMKMKAAKSDIAEIIVSAADVVSGPKVKPIEAARSRGINVQLAESDASMGSGEINVIGQNVDEATAAVEKFIDRAYLTGMPRVRVVHGMGMGILRKALRQYLKTHPNVESVSEPPYNEGGAGVTLVEMKP